MSKPRTNRLFFEGERMNDRAETEDTAFGLRQKAFSLAMDLKELGIELDNPRLPHETTMRRLKTEVAKRRILIEAAKLGVDVSPNQSSFTIEEKILAELPRVLEEKGLLIGATVLKNHGGEPDVPHQIIGNDFLEGGYAVRLRDMAGVFGDYDYRAVNLAIYATVIQPPATD